MMPTITEANCRDDVEYVDGDMSPECPGIDDNGTKIVITFHWCCHGLEG